MAHCCSQCDFTSNFESALLMHHQLHHETDDDVTELPLQRLNTDRSKSSSLDSSRALSSKSMYSDLKNSPSGSLRKQGGIKLASRTTSATKLLGKLRDKICRTTNLFSHPEEAAVRSLYVDQNEPTALSDCTSKAHHLAAQDSMSVKTSGMTLGIRDQKETYACHLCSFDADRITVLDRHLLNEHKIGLDMLLQLVLAKTKDSLADDQPNEPFVRQPYYRSVDTVIQNGEFVIETVAPKIKILKHTATNTDISWQDIPDLRNNCKMITKELNKLMKYPQKLEKNDLLDKMQTLNDCMCKFVDSSNAIRKVLSKEFEAKRSSTKDHNSSIEPLFELGLGEPETPREWERPHSEKLDRSRSHYRDEKNKLTAESYYF